MMDRGVLVKRNLGKIAFIDAEVDVTSKKILDIGAVTGDGREFHSGSVSSFTDFLHGCEYVCGHNIINHDMKYLGDAASLSGAEFCIDTLFLSPLLFPKKPYHRLVKDDKLVTSERNNPLNDSKKARDLFFDEVAAFKNLNEQTRRIYTGLLSGAAEFKDFLRYADTGTQGDDSVVFAEHSGTVPLCSLIREKFSGKICANAPIERLAAKYPIELAYALALIGVIKHDSVTPPWVLKNYPRTENTIHFLRNRRCASCPYCDEYLNEERALKRFFHFKGFRVYEGEPLQQDAVKATIAEKSILVVFPTGGGKSVTFQLPALMAGQNEKGLTVVISPLQSLMKDQTDNLENQYNITDAVTINGSLDPIERAEAVERVENGSASILYISPESLRSRSIETLLLKRNVVRFVIDEAHCFSTWGQDFRVDYLYIGDFIRGIKEKKDMPQNIPVSCFTATAKKKVISDIRDYFRDKLSLELEVFRAGAARKNLSFNIISVDSDERKDVLLRELLCENDCPTIVYASRVSRTEKVAMALTGAGVPAKPYNGQMDKHLRVATQDEFMSGDLRTIVATTAFGMGVDKKDVGMVIHYDISQSVEDYIQEAGRAGRDESIEAGCYVLYDEEDLNKHFILLNQSKVTLKEVRQIWRALKELIGFKEYTSQSSLEIARAAGWDDSVSDMETRVKTAVNALEQSGFVRRGQNMPRIFADSILVSNMEEAKARIDRSVRFDDVSRVQAVRIMSSLMSAKSKAMGAGDDGESAVDYISDRLGIEKEHVIRVIRLLREEKILADAKDLVAFIKKGEKQQHSDSVLTVHRNIESFLLGYLDDGEKTYNIKEMNEALQAVYPEATIKKLNAILNYYDIKRFVKRIQEFNSNHVTLKPYMPMSDILPQSNKRGRIAKVIVDYLFSKIPDEHATGAAARTVTSSETGSMTSTETGSMTSSETGSMTSTETGVIMSSETSCVTSPAANSETSPVARTVTSSAASVAVEFSVLELKEEFAHNLFGDTADAEEIEDALYYLLKIGAMRIDGGFLVIYNAMRIERLDKNNKVKYSKEHYAKLEEFYRNKRQQIHIVGEYAKRLLEGKQEAEDFVDDYFAMEHDMFLLKYFKGRGEELRRNITPAKYRQLFGELSQDQLKVIKNQDSRYIVVAAGPGSGKTKLLTHKLASLYIMEDIKHEQMLMLTFSRAAATEFKLRLKGLIGNAVNYIQIMTFHSYCFDLLGKVGDLEKSGDIIEQTVSRINAGEVDISRLIKAVLVIDEAQDMSAAEFSLVKILIGQNEGLRLIAVGDDDQNIYEWRGSDSAHFRSLLDERGAVKYELLENYRSSANIVEFANSFVESIPQRMKTSPIVPVSEEHGLISICKLKSENTAIPVVNAVLDIKPEGSTCIATRTNEEAYNITGLLLQSGISARLIQTNKDFSLLNLVEFRDFVDHIEAVDDSYAIDDEVWENAKSELTRKYSGSTSLKSVFRLLQDFEDTRNKTKYKSDLRQFIRESRLEDLESGAGATVLVSTIHQTKGREFDNVFLSYSGYMKPDDGTKRAVYVAITRAKKNLYIFCNGNYFDRINAEGVVRTSDDTDYPEPSLLCLQLSHKDVALGFFKYRWRELGHLISGQELTVGEKGCFLEDAQVIKFSAGFSARLAELKERGYTPVKASVRHIVYWQGKDMDEEIKIILPDVELELETGLPGQ